MLKMIFMPFQATIIFKCVVPKGCYHTLNAITISLYVCVCVCVNLGEGELNMVKLARIIFRPFFSIFDFFAHVELASPSQVTGGGG